MGSDRTDGTGPGAQAWVEWPTHVPEFGSLRATVHRPARLERGAKHPCILFLHGMGECGTNGRAQLSVGLAPAILRHPDRWPFVTIFPQKSAREEEWEQHDSALLAMLDRAVLEFDVDPRRVAIHGLSQGGHGTWEMARRHPDRFAVVAPICGYPAAPRRGWMDFVRERDWTIEHAREAARALAEVLIAKPIWAAHGAADPVVPVEFTDVVVEEFRARGATPTYDRIPGCNHDSWSVTYAKPEYSAWFRSELCAS